MSTSHLAASNYADTSTATAYGNCTQSSATGVVLVDYVLYTRPLPPQCLERTSY